MNPDLILAALPSVAGADKPAVTLLQRCSRCYAEAPRLADDAHYTNCGAMAIDAVAPRMIESVAVLAYTKESHALRVSADDVALRERFAVSSAEQLDMGRRDGHGNLLVLDGATVRYTLTPKPTPPRNPK